MFFRLVLWVVCILVPLSFIGCRKDFERELFSRPRLLPAAKGAPQFDKSKLITGDGESREVHFEISEEELQNLEADQLLTKAWSALGKGAFADAIKIAQRLIDRFNEIARQQQESLNGQFPRTGEEDKYKELNAVGTAYYVIGEAYEKQGRCKEAVDYFRRAIKEFPLAQNWDPRGWYWKVRDESEAKIRKLKEADCE